MMILFLSHSEVVCKFKPIKSKQVFLTLANNLEKVHSFT